MKLSVNEAKLTGLCSRNCYSTGFEFKQFALGPEKFLELSRNEPQACWCRRDIRPACCARSGWSRVACMHGRGKNGGVGKGEKCAKEKRKGAPAIRASIVFHAGAVLYWRLHHARGYVLLLSHPAHKFPNSLPSLLNSRSSFPSLLNPSSSFLSLPVSFCKVIQVLDSRF